MILYEKYGVIHDEHGNLSISLKNSTIDDIYKDENKIKLSNNLYLPVFSISELYPSYYDDDYDDDEMQTKYEVNFFDNYYLVKPSDLDNYTLEEINTLYHNNCHKNKSTIKNYLQNKVNDSLDGKDTYEFFRRQFGLSFTSEVKRELVPIVLNSCRKKSSKSKTSKDSDYTDLDKIEYYTSRKEDYSLTKYQRSYAKKRLRELQN